jgi:hypothetical protein
VSRIFPATFNDLGQLAAQIQFVDEEGVKTDGIYAIGYSAGGVLGSSVTSKKSQSGGPEGDGEGVIGIQLAIEGGAHPFQG